MKNERSVAKNEVDSLVLVDEEERRLQLLNKGMNKILKILENRRNLKDLMRNREGFIEGRDLPIRSERLKRKKCKEVKNNGEER